MNFSDAIETINGELVYASEYYEGSTIHFIVASDLMSDVLVVDEDDILLITSLVARQSLKTAHLVGAVGMVVVNDKPIPPDLVTLAKELELTIIRSPRSKFSCCVALGKLQEK